MVLTLSDKCYVSLPRQFHMGADSESITAISISKDVKSTYCSWMYRA